MHDFTKEELRSMWTKEPRLAINNDQGPGPPVRPNDWISDLAIGTKFLCMDKVTKDILELEVLSRSTNRYVKLIDAGDGSICWHAPLSFCYQKDFLDLLE
jgi:hypothetical protein